MLEVPNRDLKRTLLSPRDLIGTFIRSLIGTLIGTQGPYRDLNKVPYRDLNRDPGTLKGPYLISRDLIRTLTCKQDQTSIEILLQRNEIKR